jgi:hypothetical protein
MTSACPASATTCFADGAYVPEFRFFAAEQVFTLDDMAYPAPAAIEMLDRVIRGLPDGPDRRDTIRLATAIITTVQIDYMVRFFGFDAEDGPEEPEPLRRDPAQVERHVISTASVANNLGDDEYVTVATGWLGIGRSAMEQVEFRRCLSSDFVVMSAVAARSPAMYLRVVLRDRQTEAERVRAQQGGGQRVLSLDAVNERAYAEIASVETNPRMAFERLIEALRANQDPLNLRLADEIETILDGSRKREIGDAKYQHLRYHLPRLRSLALELGMTPPGPMRKNSGKRRCARRYALMAPKTWYRRNHRHDSVEHRYTGSDLEAYGALAMAALPTASGENHRPVSSRLQVSSPELMEGKK